MPNALTALRRGWAKRCPHCGRGALFTRWTLLEGCASCGLVYERNHGDTWFFTILGDRVPVGLIIAALYFGVVTSRPALGMSLIGIVVGLLFWTSPNRWGLGVALHYLSRVYFTDPDDPIPPAQG
jgi:uncharacterized protein (DUF983 family)